MLFMFTVLYAVFSLDGSAMTRRNVEAAILTCDPQVPGCVDDLFHRVRIFSVLFGLPAHCAAIVPLPVSVIPLELFSLCAF